MRGRNDHAQWPKAPARIHGPAGAGAGHRQERAVPTREWLIDLHRRQPGDDLISALATDDPAEGRPSDNQIVGTSILLLIAGHETTVNLITNGMLTLLRHPQLLKRLRDEPHLIIRTVEELLRHEPSVHLLPERIALDDIEAATRLNPEAVVELVPARPRIMI